MRHLRSGGQEHDLEHDLVRPWLFRFSVSASYRMAIQGSCSSYRRWLDTNDLNCSRIVIHDGTDSRLGCPLMFIYSANGCISREDDPHRHFGAFRLAQRLMFNRHVSKVMYSKCAAKTVPHRCTCCGGVDLSSREMSVLLEHRLMGDVHPEHPCFGKSQA
jgi:hypothetical protein